MSRIHFASLFGVDLDRDIISPWSRHYLSMGYDSYTVFLHTVDISSAAYEFARFSFKMSDFTVCNAPQEPYTVQMQTAIFEDFSKSLPPDDYLVIADSDEFHTTGTLPENFRGLILSCDMLCGTLIDRWNNTLREFDPKLSLGSQYPYSGDLFSILQKESDAPDKQRWWKPNRNKILAARAGMPVAYQGSHCLNEQVTDVTTKSGCVVNHFSWRNNALDRLKTKFYHSESFDDAVRKYFRVEAVPV
jgi:hypothetical protein